MKTVYTEKIDRSPRIPALIEHLYAKMPQIEAERGVLLTESYKQTEGQPIVLRRAKAFAHILAHLPITIRPLELIVGSNTREPRSCQVFPEYSYEWLESEFETVATRSADPFYISEETKKTLREVYPYWKGKTTSELATAYMAPEAPLDVRRLTVALSQHIGAPAVAAVQKGDKVTAGQVIASPADKALSVAIHAPLDGTVTEVTDKHIIITL